MVVAGPSSSSSSSNRPGYYITEECERPLVNFQYSGADLSPIYKHILSPLAEFLVQQLPTWIAPNAITLFALSWMVVSYIIIWFYCPNFSEAVDDVDSVPRWIFLFNCCAMLIYQTLDNMDGKQARRTGSSSALGLLFDHGCDSFNSMLGSANWMCAMGVRPTELFIVGVLVLAPMTAFYVCTWEEYYTGSLVLPVMNGPTEGLLGGALLSFITFWYGVEYWQSTSWFDLMDSYLPELIKSSMASEGVRNMDLMVLTSLFLLMREVADKISNVVLKYGVGSLLNLFPMAALIGLSVAALKMHPEIFFDNPRTCLHLVCVLFCEMVTQIMLSRMTKTNFNPMRWVLLPFLLFFVLSPEHFHDLLLGYAVAMMLYLWIKVQIVIHEICCVLKIWCFDIVTPYTTGKTVPITNGNGHAH